MNLDAECALASSFGHSGQINLKEITHIHPCGMQFFSNSSISQGRNLGKLHITGMKMNVFSKLQTIFGHS